MLVPGDDFLTLSAILRSPLINGVSLSHAYFSRNGRNPEVFRSSLAKVLNNHPPKIVDRAEVRHPGLTHEDGNDAEPEYHLQVFRMFSLSVRRSIRIKDSVILHGRNFQPIAHRGQFSFRFVREAKHGVNGRNYRELQIQIFTSKNLRAERVRGALKKSISNGTPWFMALLTSVMTPHHALNSRIHCPLI